MILLQPAYRYILICRYFEKCKRGHAFICKLFVSNNIPGVLPAKWATKGKEMSQVNFLFVDLSPVLVLFCFFFKFP